MIQKKKLAKMRRRYKPQNLFFYEPSVYFDKIDKLRKMIEKFNNYFGGLSFLTNYLDLLNNIFQQTEYAEFLIYKFTEEEVDNVHDQEDLFGECADFLRDSLLLLDDSAELLILPIDKEYIKRSVPGHKKTVDELWKNLKDDLNASAELLEHFQKNIYDQTAEIKEVGNDLCHILMRPS